MSVPTLHTIKIIPAGSRANADKALEKLGWGPGTHSVSLSPTGTLPATHYAACFPEYETQAAEVDEVKGGKLKGEVTATEAQALAKGANARQPRKDAEGGVVWDYATPREHFLAVIAARGLKEIIPPSI